MKDEQEYEPRQVANNKETQSRDLAEAKKYLTPVQIRAMNIKTAAWLNEYPQHAF